MNTQDKKELQAFKVDMEAEANRAELENKENSRREWAQENGNDSGFDPYWAL